MAAIYCADLWCDDCADLIRARIQVAGKAPSDLDNEASYDSDEYPKHAGDDEESDSPQHCGLQGVCVNAVQLSDGNKVGMLFGSLTGDGVEYVKQAIAEGGLVAELWKKHYEADDMILLDNS